MWLSLLARYWYVAAIGLVVAWGGLGWYGKNSAENALAQYKLDQAVLVAQKQAEIIELQAEREKASAAITASFLQGRKETEKRYADQLSELAALRGLWAARGMRRDADGGDTLSADPGAASDPSGAACTDRPGDLIEGANRAVAALGACEVEIGRLKALQEWARSL